MSRTATWVAGLLATSATLLAQTSDPLEVVDSIEVRLAEVEVSVTDGRGRPVRGLGQEDFEVLLGDQPLPIRGFTAYGGADETGDATTAAVSPQPPAPLPEPLLLALFLDPTFLQPGDLDRLVGDLRTFLTGGLPEGTRLLLATGGQSLEVLEGPVVDPSRVIARFDELDALPARGQLNLEYQQVLRSVERTLLRGPVIQLQDRGEVARSLLAQIQTFAREVQAEVRLTSGQLIDLVEHIGPMPGRKEVLLLSGGIPIDAGEQLFNLWQSAFGTGSLWRSGGAATTDALPDLSLGVGAASLLGQVAARANERRVTFNTLDTGGLRAPALFQASQIAGAGERGSEAALAPQLTPSTGMADGGALRQLAAATGGRALSRSRKLPENLAELAGDWTSYYLLAVTPPPATEAPAAAVRRSRAGDSATSATATLEVRLRQGGRRMKVRHRQSIRPQDRDRLAAERTLTALLTGSSSDSNPHGEAGAGLEHGLEPRILLLATPEPEDALDDGAPRVEVQVEVPLARLALIADGHSHRAQFSLFLSTGDPGGRLGPVQKIVVPVSVDNRRLLTLLGRQIEYRLAVPVEPGASHLAVTVRDDYAAVFSSRVLPLTDPLPPVAARPARLDG